MAERNWIKVLVEMELDENVVATEADEQAVGDRILRMIRVAADDEDPGFRDVTASVVGPAFSFVRPTTPSEFEAVSNYLIDGAVHWRITEGHSGEDVAKWLRGIAAGVDKRARDQMRWPRQ